MRLMIGILALLLPGCVARTALDVVTLPVKVAAKTVVLATTSQEESDRNRGRELREQEEREAKQSRIAEKRARICARDPDDEDCVHDNP